MSKKSRSVTQNQTVIHAVTVVMAITSEACVLREMLLVLCATVKVISGECRKSQNQSISAAAFSIATAEPSKFCCSFDGGSGLQNRLIIITINNTPVKALSDTGSTDNYINPQIAKLCNIKLKQILEDQQVTMASGNCQISIKKGCGASLCLHDQVYENVNFKVMEGLCVDIILGLEFLDMHHGVHLPLNGTLPTLYLNAIKKAQSPSHRYSNTSLRIDPSSVFLNLSDSVRPIACKSQKYSNANKEFISEIVQEWLKAGKIEPS